MDAQGDTRIRKRGPGRGGGKGQVCGPPALPAVGSSPLTPVPPPAAPAPPDCFLLLLLLLFLLEGGGRLGARARQDGRSTESGGRQLGER